MMQNFDDLFNHHFGDKPDVSIMMTPEQLKDIVLLADSAGITIELRPGGYMLRRNGQSQLITYEQAADAIDPLSIFRHHMMVIQ